MLPSCEPAPHCGMRLDCDLRVWCNKDVNQLTSHMASARTKRPHRTTNVESHDSHCMVASLSVTGVSHKAQARGQTGGARRTFFTY